MSEGARFVRPSLDQLPAGDPAPSLPAGVASLGLNEGLNGPFPAALAAIATAVPDVSRYPGRGSYELVAALAVRHDVAAAQVIVAAGADAVIGYVCQAVLEPGDGVVVPWPSFPSFVRDPQKRDAVVAAVPLAEGSIDLDAMGAAVTPATRLVFVATPNNPTGRVVPRDDVMAFVRDLPRHVLAVIDEAYFDYLEPEGRLDAIADLVRAGDAALALRTFSKLYGLAGLRIGYGVGPAAVVAAMRKVQRGYDVGALAQAAALASLGADDEVERRRAANRAAMEALVSLLRLGPAVAWGHRSSENEGLHRSAIGGAASLDLVVGSEAGECSRLGERPDVGAALDLPHRRDYRRRPDAVAHPEAGQAVELRERPQRERSVARPNEVRDRIEAALGLEQSHRPRRSRPGRGAGGHGRARRVVAWNHPPGRVVRGRDEGQPGGRRYGSPHRIEVDRALGERDGGRRQRRASGGRGRSSETTARARPPRSLARAPPGRRTRSRRRRRPPR